MRKLRIGDKVKFIGTDQVFHGLLEGKSGMVAGAAYGEPDYANIAKMGAGVVQYSEADKAYIREHMMDYVYFQIPPDTGNYIVAAEDLALCI